MPHSPLPPGPEQEPPRVNFFRPLPGFMRREVIFIWIALCGWALVTFGFQFLLAARVDEQGRGVLTETTILGFPFHYWFTGQFLIIWFIFLCVLFNLLVDRISDQYRQRR